MKIIQSLWTKPLWSGSDGSDKWVRTLGGWPSLEFFLISWTLSCLSLKKYYRDVELVTDQQGKYLLMDRLQLPYTACTTALDALAAYHPDLWAVGKIYAYQLQEAPFIHVDGDIYIWKKFPERIINAPLVGQNSELDHAYYFEILDQSVRLLEYLPGCLLRYKEDRKEIRSVDAGIIGGNDLAFFKKYADEAFAFVDKNAAVLHKINRGQFNIIFEQLLYHSLSVEKGVKIAYLFDPEPSNFFSFVDFKGVPFRTHYIHAFGSDYKKMEHVCVQMRRKLYEMSPACYFSIQHLLKENILPSQG